MTKHLSKLTVRQALEETVALWDWLAEHPEADKEDWPGWADWDDNPHSECFLCEIAWGTDCRGCPLYNRWGVKPQTKTRYCNSTGGLFKLWETATDKKRARYAQLLADRARTVLAEEQGND